MKKKLIIKSMLLIILAMVVVTLTYNYLDGLNSKVSVYMADQNIDIGSVIDEDMLRRVEIGYDEKVMFFDDAYETLDEIIGLVTTEAITKSDVIGNDSFLVIDSENDDVLDDEGNINDDYFIKSGNRIAFISLSKTNALGGDLKKGNFIDLLYTSQSDYTGGVYTSMLLQKIKVFEVLGNSESNTLVDVQIEVTPEQGMILSLAKYNGKIDFMLANEKSIEVDIIPKLPEDLYAKLIEAGYMMVNESGENVGQSLESGSITMEGLENELLNAESNLESAINSLNAARMAFDAEKNARTKRDLYDLVEELDASVKQLQNAVEVNKGMLEGIKGGQSE